jgi:hypothetical protein
MRWLAHVDVAGRELGASAILRLDRTYAYLGEGQIAITTRVRDKEGQPAGGAQASVTVTPEGGGKTERIPLAATAAPGVLKASWRPSKEGHYTIQLSAKDSRGAALGTDKLGVRIIRQNTELQHLACDDKFMRELARVSGGIFGEIDSLPDLLDRIQQQHQGNRREVKPQMYRLFNFPALFLLFVALLTVEWLLRRYWQLQ